MALRLNTPYPLCLSGSGMLWCWGFLHFFQSQASLVGVSGVPLGDFPYLGSTLLVSLCIAVAATGREGRLGMPLAICGCLLLVTGTALDFAAGAVALAAVELRLMANIALGGGMGLFWIAWGCLYVRSETEDVEHAFMGWFPLLVILLPAALATRLLGEAGELLYAGLLVVLPCASLACFRASLRRGGREGGGGAYLEGCPGAAGAVGALGRGAVLPLVNLACVFAATSLAWNAFLSHAVLGFGTQIALFALGVIASFLIIWLALRTTRHFSLSTLYRWALPLMAAGVVLFQFSPTALVAPAFLCLSVVNIGFEVMGKLFCIYVAKRNPRYTVGIIAGGFATATVGGLIGTSLWGAIGGSLGMGAARNTLLAALVVFVVAASLALGRGDDAHGGGNVPAREARALGAEPAGLSDSLAAAGPVPSAERSREEKCLAVAERYGLSPRERDVLLLLAEGRSRAHIRETLYISKGTVNAHIHNIYAKTGISSRDELMRLLLD